MSEGYEVYEVYLFGHEKDIEEGNPFEMELKDRATYERKVVKAKVSREKEKLNNPAPLYVRDYQKDEEKPGNLWIEIVEELPDDYIVPRPDEKEIPKETFKVY